MARASRSIANSPKRQEILRREQENYRNYLINAKKHTKEAHLAMSIAKKDNSPIIINPDYLKIEITRRETEEKLCMVDFLWSQSELRQLEESLQKLHRKS